MHDFNMLVIVRDPNPEQNQIGKFKDDYDYENSTLQFEILMIE